MVTIGLPRMSFKNQKIKSSLDNNLVEMWQSHKWHTSSRRDTQSRLDFTHTKRIEIMNTATVKPISNKAKNRFANLMGSDAHVIIEQHLGDRVFLTSANGRNHFWVTLDKDADWMVELWDKDGRGLPSLKVKVTRRERQQIILAYGEWLAWVGVVPDPFFYIMIMLYY